MDQQWSTSLNRYMKTILKMLTTLLMVNRMLPEVNADDLSFGEPKLPASQWEQHSDGIALAIIPTRRIDKEYYINKPIINIYIKNTSNSIKNFPAHGMDFGIELYYINSNGFKVPLHDYSQKQFFSMNLGNIPIQPGATLLVPIDISEKEALLLKTVPVECRIELSDPATNQSFTIESSP